MIISSLKASRNPLICKENRLSCGSGQGHWLEVTRLGLYSSLGRLLTPQTLAITMPEQRDHTARNDAHGDTRQHGQGAFSQSQSSRPAVQDVRRNAPALHSRATEPSAPGSRRSPEVSPMEVDAINVTAQILPNWEIDVTTNMMLHLHCCRDCLLFSKHAHQYLQGGALAIYLKRQRKHWR
jgi:hypothetical protein